MELSGSARAEQRVLNKIRILSAQFLFLNPTMADRRFFEENSICLIFAFESCYGRYNCWKNHSSCWNFSFKACYGR